MKQSSIECCALDLVNNYKSISICLNYSFTIEVFANVILFIGSVIDKQSHFSVSLLAMQLIYNSEFK